MWKELKVHQRTGQSPHSQKTEAFFANRKIQFHNHLSREQPLTGIWCQSETAGEGLHLLNNLQPCYCCKYANEITGPNVLTSCRGDSLSSPL